MTRSTSSIEIGCPHPSRSAPPSPKSLASLVQGEDRGGRIRARQESQTLHEPRGIEGTAERGSLTRASLGGNGQHGEDEGRQNTTARRSGGFGLGTAAQGRGQVLRNWGTTGCGKFCEQITEFINI
jgi:hypothetical protein